MSTVRARFVDALRRRLYPNTPLHLEQLAGPAGVSAFTVGRYWRGETKIPADVVYGIAEFFARQGDRTFILEVYGPGLLPAEEPDESMRRMIRMVLEEQAKGRVAQAAARDGAKVIRLPLERVSGRLAGIYQAWTAAPVRILDAAGKLDMTGRVLILTDRASDVTCQWVGRDLAIPRDCVGQNVLAWPDHAHGSEVRRAALEARASGPVLSRVEGCVFGKLLRWTRLALPHPNDNTVFHFTLRESAA